MLLVIYFSGMSSSPFWICGPGWEHMYKKKAYQVTEEKWPIKYKRKTEDGSDRDSR